MDENELLMILLSKKCNEFWKKNRKIILDQTMIPKRVILVNPMSNSKRFRLIQLQKMYNYIDISITLNEVYHTNERKEAFRRLAGGPNTQPEVDLSEYLIFDYFLSYI